MAKAKILSQAPVLLVSDLGASLAYWRDSIGFEAHVWGEPPDFAIVQRDNAFVMLSQKPADHTITPLWMIKDQLWNAYFWVDDVRAIYQELVASGAKIDYHLGTQPYGVLEFGIQDLDGHDIAFGEVLED